MVDFSCAFSIDCLVSSVSYGTSTTSITITPGLTHSPSSTSISSIDSSLNSLNLLPSSSLNVICDNSLSEACKPTIHLPSSFFKKNSIKCPRAILVNIKERR